MSSFFRNIVSLWILLGALTCGLRAQTTLPTVLGDFDADGVPTVADLVRLTNHLKGIPVLPVPLVPFADMDQNDVVNVEDIELLIDVIMEREPLTLLPAAYIDGTSPFEGEDNVAVTREMILNFSLPFADDATFGSEQLYATYAGEKLLGRIEVSSDRMKLTLFHQENLPSSARIRITFDPGEQKDYLGRIIDADGDGEAGGIGVFEFRTLGITTLPGTGIGGQIFASEKDENNDDVPLAGVVVEVVGAEDDIRTTTAADGSFTLSPAPAGRFFVNVDGRPVTGGFPDGDYYPFVTKAWETIPGKADNLANGTGIVYLPCVCAGTLQTVSSMETSEVEFPQQILDEQPELEGVSVFVPPNSLFSNSGARGGKLGIAPVSADRLPEPLPDGLVTRLVITVQTDGASNFDIPVPVRFPNLPHPFTGQTLPPGSKTLLYSFNHDTGVWEVQGPMTISGDGLFAVSDPGVGIRQPGWHVVPPVPRSQVRWEIVKTVQHRARTETYMKVRFTNPSGGYQILNAKYRRPEQRDQIIERFLENANLDVEFPDRWTYSKFPQIRNTKRWMKVNYKGQKFKIRTRNAGFGVRG